MKEVILFCKKNNYKYLRNKKNVGFVGNWNNCIKKALGEYVCILHSDDLLTRNWCSEFSKYIAKNPEADVFSCALTLVNTTNIPTDMYYPLSKTGMLKNNYKEIFDANYNVVSVSGAMVIKKSVFKNIGLFKPEFGTECDVWFYNKLMKECKIYYIDKILFGYKIHALQTIDKKMEIKTNKIKIDKLKRGFSIIKLFFKKELKNNKKMRFVYVSYSLVGYIVVIKYLLLLDFKSASTLNKVIKKYFPDVLSTPEDYAKLFTILIDYIIRIIKGKILLIYDKSYHF
jgi:GT2 family glycosyltransferase